VLLKLNASYDILSQRISYQHPLHNRSLNDDIGHRVLLTIGEKTTCQGCFQVKKIQRGYCYLCSRRLARCDLCFLNPHLCHFKLGTCREPQWAEQVCMKEHLVYLALTSSPKVGITQITQVPTRWIDQGAIWAKILMRTGSRRDAGLIEKDLINTGWKGQSQWRDLLKGNLSVQPDAMDALYERAQREAIQFAQKRDITYRILTCDNKVFAPIFPIHTFLTKAISLPFPGTYEGVLTGIKGQYLFFGESGAVNMRAYEGHTGSLERVE